MMKSICCKLLYLVRVVNLYGSSVFKAQVQGVNINILKIHFSMYIDTNSCYIDTSIAESMCVVYTI